MRHLHIKYNQAISLMKQNQFEEARELLDSVLRESPSNHKIKWAKGLVDVMSGNPFMALSSWDGLDNKDFPSIDAKKQLIDSKLEKYKKIYDEYNKGLSLIKTKNFEEAVQIFQELVQQEKEVPLPFPVYKSYFMLLLLLNRQKDFIEKLQNAPKHIQNLKGLKALLLKVMEQKDYEQPTRTFRYRKLAVFVAGLFLFIGGSFAGHWFPKNEGIGKISKTSTVEKNNQKGSEYQEEIAVLKQDIQKQELQRNEQEEKESLIEKELNKAQETSELINAAGVQMSDIKVNASLNLYRQGLDDYKKGNYEQASDLLEKSYKLTTDQYFSDDTLFYLINSYIKANDFAKAEENVGRFLSNKVEAFVNSPYYNDSMLIKAELLINRGKKSEASILLSQIEKQFPKEWTAKKAQSLQKQLSNE